MALIDAQFTGEGWFDAQTPPRDGGWFDGEMIQVVEAVTVIPIPLMAPYTPT
jgi:hypothetical protein